MTIKEIVLSILIVVILFISVNVGLNKQEKYECYTWQKQAQENPNFYLLQWQKEQCDAHHISVN